MPLVVLDRTKIKSVYLDVSLIYSSQIKLQSIDIIYLLPKKLDLIELEMRKCSFEHLLFFLYKENRLLNEVKFNFFRKERYAI